ncbi:MAG TPA: hypothetical protein PKM88_00070 [bacterium]|nr:hypothetical protein [bacterium]
MRILLTFGCMLLALLATGCLDYTQEIVVRPDGSGSSTVDFGMSTTLMAMGNQEQSDGLAESRTKFTTLRDRLRAHPAVSDAQYREYQDGDLQHFVVTVELPDITRLGEVQADLSAAQANENAGNDNRSEVTLQRQTDGSLAFRYQLALAGQAQTDGEDASMTEVTRQMMQSAFAGRYFTVRLRGPQVTLPDAANGGVCSADGSSVQWRIPFTDLFSGTGVNRDFTAVVSTAAAGRTLPAASITPVGLPVIAVYTGSVVPTLPTNYAPNYQLSLRPLWLTRVVYPLFPYQQHCPAHAGYGCRH